MTSPGLNKYPTKTLYRKCPDFEIPTSIWINWIHKSCYEN